MITLARTEVTWVLSHTPNQASSATVVMSGRVSSTSGEEWPEMNGEGDELQGKCTVDVSNKS